MNITVLKSKIHRAIITDSSLDYEGSMTIDSRILDMANIREYERIFIYNVNNGKRWETYAINGGVGEYILNGASARNGMIGDVVIICSYGIIDQSDKTPEPFQVILRDNKVFYG